MEADGDGNFSLVIAAKDPGVHNWVDTLGLHEFSAGLRWQGISPNAKRPPHIETRVIDAKLLPEAMPAKIRKVSPEQRAAQIRQRQETYDRRFVEA
jgi:hypothetical protein